MKKLVQGAFVVVLGFLGSACSTGPGIARQVDPMAAQAPDASRAIAQKRSELAARRAVQIDRLHTYAQGGEFPKNRIRPVKANVFRDEDGHLCAIANLVHLDGQDDLVDRAARDNNLVRVAEQPSGPLHDWVLTSGLTREEVAFIQEPYMPVQPSAAWEAGERARLQAHFVEAERRLVRDTDASLDLAMDRLADEPAGDAVAEQRFATPPGT